MNDTGSINQQPWSGGGLDASRSFYVSILLLVLPLCWSHPLPAQQSVTNADLVVAKPVINMYKSATPDSEVTSQALYGTGVLSIQKKGDWINIRTADGYSGWVAASDVQLQKGSSYSLDGNSVRVTGLSANIYREPDVTRHAPIMPLPWEARLEVFPGTTEHHSRWLKVRLIDGEIGWVQRGDVGSTPAPLTIEEMLYWRIGFSASPTPGEASAVLGLIAPASHRCWCGKEESRCRATQIYRRTGRV
jgi:SH3-like domain-containing protein